MKTQFLLLFFGSLFIFGCAKELSEEEQKREETERNLSRIQKAEGHFEGHIVSADKQSALPLSLEITTRRNPIGNDEMPQLQVAMKLGLFNGLSISTTETKFDYGTNTFSAKFPKNFGPGIEISGTIDQGQSITSLNVYGPQSGRFRAQIHRVQRPALFANDKEPDPFLVTLTTHDPGQTPLQGLLYLKRKEQDKQAPDTSDFAYLPDLDGGLKIQGAGTISQTIKSVLYDPLKGLLEMSFHQGGQFRFTNLFLKRENSNTSTGVTINNFSYDFKDLKGVLINKSKIEGVVSVVKMTEENAAKMQSQFNLRPEIFKGTLQGKKDFLKYTVLATLTSSDHEIQNTSETFFESFPEMSLKITLCLNGRPYSETDYLLKQLDYMAKQLVFVSPNSSNRHVIKMKFSENWKQLQGRIEGDENSSLNSNETSKLELVEVTHRRQFSCKEN